MFGKRTVFSLLLVLSLLASVLAACGTTPAPTSPPAKATDVPATAVPAAKDLLDEVKEAGNLLVSTDPNYAPQSFLNDSGELDGFDVDVAKEVAKRLGVEVEFVTPDWDMITGGNWGGRWDLSIGSMTPTEAALRDPVVHRSLLLYPGLLCRAQGQHQHQESRLIWRARRWAWARPRPTRTISTAPWPCMGGEVMYDPPTGMRCQALLDRCRGDPGPGPGRRRPPGRGDVGPAHHPERHRRGRAAQVHRHPRLLRAAGLCPGQEPWPVGQDAGRAERASWPTCTSDGTLSDLSLKWYGIDITTADHAG